MLYLDTHVLLWLHAGLLERFTPKGRRLLDRNDLFISPIVKLELQFLYEMGRITLPASQIIGDLEAQIGMQTCDLAFDAVVNRAMTLDWTRDPFDRFISAQALCRRFCLLTKDMSIRRKLKLAVW